MKRRLHIPHDLKADKDREDEYRQVTEKVAAQMAATLGWDADKTAREIDSLAPLYRTIA